MGVILVTGRRSKGFTIMSNDHLWDKRLSLKATGLLCYLMAVHRRWNVSVASLEHCFPDGQSSITAAIKELIELGYVRRERTRKPNGQQGRTHYVIFEEPLPEGAELTAELKQQAMLAELEIDESEESAPTDSPVDICPEVVPVEIPEVVSPYIAPPEMVNPAMDEPVLENPVVVCPDMENPPHINTIVSNTIQPKTKGSNNSSTNTITSNQYHINPVSTSSTVEPPPDSDPDADIDVDRIRIPEPDCYDWERILRRHIDYDNIVTPLNRGILDSLLDYMLEILFCTSETMHIAKADYNTRFVQKRILSIDSSHMQYILDSLYSCKTDRHDVKAYYMATLFNAAPTKYPFKDNLITQWMG